jgi:hypothetical protein
VESRNERRQRVEAQNAVTEMPLVSVDVQQKYVITLLRALLTAPTVVAEVIWNEGFDLEQIRDPLARVLIATVLERVRHNESNELSELLALYASQPQIQGLLVESAIDTEESPDDEAVARAQHQAEDAIYRMLYVDSMTRLKALQQYANSMNPEQLRAEHLLHTERLKRLDLLLRRHSSSIPQ